MDRKRAGGCVVLFQPDAIDVSKPGERLVDLAARISNYRQCIQFGNSPPAAALASYGLNYPDGHTGKWATILAGC